MDDETTTGSFAASGSDEPFPGVHRTGFSSRQASVTQYVFKSRAEFPIHHHPQEQITLIEKGEVELELNGDRKRLRPGDWAVVAPHTEHGIIAGPDGARVLSVVVPARTRPDDYQLTTAGQGDG